MIAVIVGFASALVYGAADFLGGTASRRISAVRVTVIAAATGLVTLQIALPFVGGTWSTDAVVLGALSGVTGTVAIGLLYACLAIGPMSILSPLTAAVSAIVPLSIGLVGGERLQPIGYVALVLPLVAVALVGFVPEKGAVRLLGVLMAIGSGVAIGAFLVIIDRTPDDSRLVARGSCLVPRASCLVPRASCLVPIVLNRAVSGAVLFAAVGVLALVARSRGTRDTRGRRAGIPLALLCGVVDAAANTGLLLGLRLGGLSVMAVLTALNPAGTIILAAVVHRERIAPVQIVGLVLAVAAGAMLALA